MNLSLALLVNISAGLDLFVAIMLLAVWAIRSGPRDDRRRSRHGRVSSLSPGATGPRSGASQR